METQGFIKRKTDELTGAMARLRGGDLSLSELEGTINSLSAELYANPHMLMLLYDLYLIQGRRGRAKSLLHSITSRSPFFSAAWFELMRRSLEDSDKKQAAEYFAKAYKYADEDERETIKPLCKTFFPRQDMAKIIFEQNYKDFPLDGKGKPMLRRKIFEGRTTDNHFLNLYKTNLDITPSMSTRSFLKCETIMGDFAEGEAEFDANIGDILAVSAWTKPMDLDIILPSRVVSKKNLARNRFHYYRLPEGGKVKLCANDKIFYRVFSPRNLPNVTGNYSAAFYEKSARSIFHKPKLVLFIFVDGLSYRFLEENNFAETMPNIHKFFAGGFRAENCYATGEWTLPSVTGMATGKYTANHGAFHTDFNYDTEKLNRMMQEYFHDAGYLTARVCGNWRTTPNHGYFKKNDRIVYAAMFDRMHVEDATAEAIEHMECFKDFHNFLWLTIEDLHDVSDDLSNSPLSDLKTEKLSSNDIDAEVDISVFQVYSENKVNAYLAELKRIDFWLETLFNYLEKNYKDDEMLIVLNSDHGQGYLSDERTMFHEKRAAVPLLMRGIGVPNVQSDAMISNIDILPAMLSLCDLPPAEDIDGAVPKEFGGRGRDFTYTESIFAGQTYKAAIHDGDHAFLFNTKAKVRDDGTVDMARYKYQLFNRQTGEDESELFAQKVEFYQSIIYEHMAQRLYI